MFDMHGSLGPMDLEPRWQVTDDDVTQAQPHVRALHVRRYEELWAIVTGRLKAAEAMGVPPDPRWVDTGLKVLKAEAVLYRLDKVPVHGPEDEDMAHVVDPVDLVLDSLQDIEAKLAASQ